jgi:SAM-dependent methyltransferase
MDEHLDANRAHWDDRAAIHLESHFYDVEGWLRDRPGPRARELDALGDVDGLTLAHLQCHFGLDTLAFARAGATVTGLDFSPTAIDAARQIAQQAGLASASTFVCANVDDAPTALDHATFDIVYVSLGALCWLPSVERWARAAATLLVRPGGRLYLHDIHPLAWALADDAFTLTYTYFEQAEPLAIDEPQTYTDQDRPLAHPRNYEWNHSLGEIVTALIGAGLRITRLVEHDWTVHQAWPWLVPVPPAHGVGSREHRWTNPASMPRVPLTYTLMAERP